MRFRLLEQSWVVFVLGTVSHSFPLEVSNFSFVRGCYIKSILYPLTWAPADCILTSRRGFELCTKMGTRHLWFIDRDGRVFLFNLRDKSWRHISTPKLGSRNCFKRISAVEQCAWAISASQQPYLFVHSTELPIRVKVQTYENQRWGIYGGWKATEKSVRPLLLFYD